MVQFTRSRAWRYAVVFMCGILTVLLRNLLINSDQVLKDFARAVYYTTVRAEKARIEVLREQCALPRVKTITNHTVHIDKVQSQILVDTRYNISYCNVPKIGSTFWFSVFHILRNAEKDTKSPYDIMRKYGENLQQQVGPKIVKQSDRKKPQRPLGLFLFVRDPYARLFSAYVDKFVRPNKYYWNAVGRYIVRNFRRNATETALKCGHDVTFEEFLRYFVASETPSRKVFSDYHWTPIYKLCAPCHYDYQFIGKTETFAKDTKEIIQNTNLDQQINFEHGGSKQMQADTTDKLKLYLDELVKLRNCSDIKKDVSRLWFIFAEKGHVNPGTQPPTLPAEVTTANKDKYLKILSEKLVCDINKQSFPGSAKKYKHEVLVKAYRNIPRELLLQVRDVLLPDFLLFGYDPEPSYLFSE